MYGGGGDLNKMVFGELGPKTEGLPVNRGKMNLPTPVLCPARAAPASAQKWRNGQEDKRELFFSFFFFLQCERFHK